MFLRINRFFSNLHFERQVSIAPLVSFRIAFGLLMAASLLRFWWRGWVTTVYVLPPFHFTYWGFEWVRPLGAIGMHILFVAIILASLCIAFGLAYRIATITFFAGFTYIELIDVTTYLNHYYFISLVAFIMIWLPAGRSYSLDIWLRPYLERRTAPAWCINILRFQMAVVYVFAGLAKLNPDWLLDAQPMRTWLPAKTHLPIVGKFMYEIWVAYLFSWVGAAYDLLIVGFLLYRRTQLPAYCCVVLFHVATAIFFPGIGMFPYVMIACSPIFFTSAVHLRVLSILPFYRVGSSPDTLPGYVYSLRYRGIIHTAIGLYMLLQLVIPLRYLAYPGHLFWHEEGYRFSWRVMLMEKSGAAYFAVKDPVTHQSAEVSNGEFLTPLQEKMMSTQPDLILKFAHFLAQAYKVKGYKNPRVYGEVYVSLNGQRSRLFIDSTIDLAAEPLSWGHYHWVLPYQKGEEKK